MAEKTVSGLGNPNPRVLESELTMQDIVQARAELSRAIASFWASPAGQVIKMRLSFQAESSGFAQGMRNIMAGVAPQIRALAARTRLRQAYKAAWGK